MGAPFPPPTGAGSVYLLWCEKHVFAPIVTSSSSDLIFCGDIIAFVSINSCMSACELTADFLFHHVHNIIMPLLLVCEELHLINPVFLPGPVT